MKCASLTFTTAKAKSQSARVSRDLCRESHSRRCSLYISRQTEGGGGWRFTGRMKSPAQLPRSFAQAGFSVDQGKSYDWSVMTIQGPIQQRLTLQLLDFCNLTKTILTALPQEPQATAKTPSSKEVGLGIALPQPSPNFQLLPASAYRNATDHTCRQIYNSHTTQS